MQNVLILCILFFSLSMSKRGIDGNEGNLGKL